MVSNIFGHAQICTNDCFVPKSSSEKGVVFVFTCSIVRTKDEVYHPWCLSPHGDFLGILRSNFEIFNLLGALQRVNSVE